MRYDWEYRRPRDQGRARQDRRSAYDAGWSRECDAYRFRRRRSVHRPTFPPEGHGFYGGGELRRYGRAPVPYGPDHTYDFRFGDHYGYGPDFYQGEARVRNDPALARREWPRRRSRGPSERNLRHYDRR